MTWQDLRKNTEILALAKAGYEDADVRPILADAIEEAGFGPAVGPARLAALRGKDAGTWPDIITNCIIRGTGEILHSSPE